MTSKILYVLALFLSLQGFSQNVKLKKAFNGKDLKVIAGLLVIRGVLIYIKSTKSRKWLTAFISKKLEK